MVCKSPPRSWCVAVQASLASVACAVLVAVPAWAADWTRWGGPQGNFTVAAQALADSWGENGPRELWRVPLGDHGHSTLLVEGDRVFAFVRRGDQDVLAALDAVTGKMVWETAYASPLPEGYNNQFGPGPHATPLLVGDRIFTISSTHVVKAFNKVDGKELWSVPMKERFDIPQMGRGYGASPLPWKGLVIVNGGGKGSGVVAFRQDSGEVAWKALDGAGYSSPLIAVIDGVPQVLAALGSLRAGLDPDTGAVLWQIELPSTAATTFASQVMADDHLLFGSSAYADGSRVLDVRKVGDEWKTEVLWYSRKMRLMHGTAVRSGNLVLASSGDFGPAFLTALDLESGELVFRERGFAKANVIKIGERILLLDEDGKLALLEVGAQGIDILAEKEGVLSGVTWAAPTVVGTKAFLRSRTEVVALELGKTGTSP